MEKIDEVIEFYNAGAEIGRLDRGLGKIEYFRTKEILSNYISDVNTIYDVGGGIGVYSSWLASLGNQVHLLELAPSAVEFAKQNQSRQHPYIAEVGDARRIERPDESADIVLLMGPIYHLQEKEDRIQAIKEAYRVLKKDGLLFTVGISKFSSTNWALSTYGKDNNNLDDEIYFNMIQNELLTGKHIRPKEYPNFISQAYFHKPSQLQEELESVGLKTIGMHAIEGIIWFTPQLDEKWSNEDSRERLLNIVRMTESEDAIMGMSPHFMVISRK